MQISVKYIISILILWLVGSPLFSQIPLNWTIDEVNPGEDISLFPDESNFTDGMKSCHMQLHSGAVPYLISEIFYVTPGTDYQFSIDVFDNDTSGQVKIYADFFDIYGFNIFGEPPVLSTDSGEWQTISWQDSVPGQAAVGYILVKFYCQPDFYSFTKTADIWIDNIQFREAQGNNLVVNGSFEEWVVGIDDEPILMDELIVYPNPAKDFVSVRLIEGIKCAVISDLTGRELLRQEVKEVNSFQLDISSLPPGNYLISVLTFEDQRWISNLLISR